MRKTPGYYLIRPYENGEMLTVGPTNQGKMIAFTTVIEEGAADTFNVSLSWSSLEKLQAKMKMEDFNWGTPDRSLFVTGKDGKISLQFMNTAGLTPAIETLLSDEQAELFKVALSKKAA